MNDITTKQVISLWDAQVGGFLPDKREMEIDNIFLI
jgi:hypothetical protein